MVRCQERTKDRFGRTVAICLLGDEDLGAWMVAQGWALAFRRYSNRYVPGERGRSERITRHLARRFDPSLGMAILPLICHHGKVCVCSFARHLRQTVPQNMATKEQYEIFKMLFDQEDKRYTNLIDRGKTFVSLATLYSGFITFTIEKLHN